MSEISRFKYYKQLENHVTNSTLLVLHYFYQESPQKLEEILRSLSKVEEISIGPNFGQQIPFPESTPDGLISQKPLNIHFEVKGSGAELNMNQIKNHINSIKPKEGVESSTKILFALTSNKVPQTTVNELSDLAKEKKITFAAITFADVLKTLQESCEPHETKLHDILNDYEQFLSLEKLLIGESMIVMPVPFSLEDNKKFHMCCEKVERNKAKISSKFIGLYKEKCIRHIGGCIATVVRGEFEGDEFNVGAIEFSRSNKEELTPDEYQRIIDLSFNISQSNGQGKDHPIKTKPHRFYLFDELKETKFIRETKGPVRGPMTLYLSRWLNYDDKKEYDTTEVADILRSKTW